MTDQKNKNKKTWGPIAGKVFVVTQIAEKTPSCQVIFSALRCHCHSQQS